MVRCNFSDLSKFFFTKTTKINFDGFSAQVNRSGHLDSVILGGMVRFNRCRVFVRPDGRGRFGRS